MKRIKNSIKALVTLICVFVVVVASVVTVIIINNRKPGGGDDPANPAYALTDDQKKLASEISAGSKNFVSKNQKGYIKYDNASISVDEVSYFDDSVIWRGDGNEAPYYILVLNEDGSPTGLAEKIVEQGIVEIGYSASKILYAAKNHFVVVFGYADNSRIVVICTVKNHKVVTNKVYNLVWKEDDSVTVWKNDDLENAEEYFAIYGEEYFVLLLRDEFGDSYFNFYEYLDNYDGYKPFTLLFEPSETEVELSIYGSDFILGENVVASYTNETGFYLTDESNLKTSTKLVNGTIFENKKIVNASDASSELVNGVYYKYSYTISVSGNAEKTIDLGEYNKLSVVYSGEKYFGVFMQKMNASHETEMSGQMVYFDYNLNIIAKYSAKSKFSTIECSDMTYLLTNEGLISSKNEITCSKVYDFSSNGFTLNSLLSNGDFVLKDETGSLIIYNFAMEQSYEIVFDEIVNYIDNNRLIYVKNGEYLIYSISTKSSSEVNFVSTRLDNKTSLYLVKNGEKFDLYSGKTKLENDIDSYDDSNENYFKYTKNGVETVYYFVEKTADNEEELQITNYGYSLSDETKSGDFDEVDLYAGNTEEDPFAENNDWYDYSDKIIQKQDPSDSTKTIIKATHCIQNGYYSKTNYYDYLELPYNNEFEGDSKTYVPYRVYYRVNIVNGNPVLKIIAKGHDRFTITESTASENNDGNSLEIDGNYYKIYCSSSDSAYSKSYDYRKRRNNNESLQLNGRNDIENYVYVPVTGDGGGVVTYNHYYVYTGSTSGYGFKFHESSTSYTQDNICKAEVYGDSIRVTLVFDFKPRTIKSFTYDLKINDCKFGNQKGIISAYKTDESYYNNLYYRTVVVSVNNENKAFNMGHDIMNNSRVQPATEYLVKTQLKYVNLSSNNYVTIGIKEKLGGFSTNYSATFSKNIYLNKSDEYSYVYLGNQEFRTRIVGGKFVGITTLNQTSYYTKIGNLYDIDNRDYNGDNLAYRAYPFESEEKNENDILPYSYLNFDYVSETYYMQVKNDSIIYYENGLNMNRFVYCVYEPETFYMELDYNVSSDDSEDTTTIGNEIDYLKKYAGVNVGVSSSNTFTRLNNTWAYKNVTEDNFGTYNNENNDKYVPKNFADNSTRFETVDTSSMTLLEKIDYIKSRESSAVIHEFKGNGERYYYITINGTRYYFQKNSGSQNLSFIEYIGGDSDSSAYFEAYRDITKLNNGVLNEDGDEIDSAVKFGNMYVLEYGTYYFGDNNSFYYYKKGVSGFYIRVAYDRTKSQWMAYYHNYNIHERQSSYDGKYAPKASGEMIKVEGETKNYSISETIAFRYTDFINFTSVPEHAHYDFVGWKVYLGDYDTHVISPTANFNPSSNPSGTVRKYLAGSGSGYFNTWLQFDEWLSNWDKPIRLVAQWKPKICTINAILWTQESGQDHLGLKFNRGDNSYNIEAGFTVSKNSVIPMFMKGTLNIDRYKNPVDEANPSGSADGIVDFSPTFNYGLHIKFSDIGSLMANNGYNSDTLNATGISCQFMNWAFQKTDGTFVTLDTTMGDEESNTLINEYIGDTTTITIYACYATSRYNFYMNLNPMGGAAKTNEGKDYVTNFRNIYNYLNDPAIYDVTIEESTNSVASKRMCTDSVYAQENGVSRVLGIDNGSNYSANFENQYYAGQSIKISLKVNEQYYFKRIVVRNLTLKDNNGQYDKFTITFIYSNEDSDGWKWVVTAVSETGHGSLTVNTNNSQGFIFGSNPYNSGASGSVNTSYSHNLFTFSQDKSQLDISITNLSDPGDLDYGKQELNGTTGFTLDCTLAAHSIDTEFVSISQENPDRENIYYNRASIISAQSLSSLEGKTPSTGKACYIWLGTTRYLFSGEWTGTAASGYYLMYSSGNVPAFFVENLTYEVFAKQTPRIDGNFYAFYDNDTKLIYYPAQNTYPGGEVDISLDSEMCNSLILDMGDSHIYQLNKGFNERLVNGKYYYVYCDNFASTFKLSERVQSDYENSYFESNNGFVVYYNNKTLYYHRKQEVSNFQIGYNNTRVISIEPEQSNIYLSSTPSNATLYGDRYELKYYLSSLIIGNTIFSFDKLTREVLSDGSRKYYGNFKLNSVIASGEGQASGSNISRLGSRVGKIFNYFGEEYTINDAYKLNINVVSGKVGATTYYLYIARNEEGYTRYFLIYDECTSNLSSSNQNYAISINFKRLKSQMDINVLEDDLYDATVRSFDVSYATDSISRYSKYTKDTTKLFSQIGDDINDFTFYENIDGDLVADLNDPTLTSLKWKSTLSFYPTTTRRFNIYANNGYIIKTIKIYVGRNKYVGGDEIEHEEELVNVISFTIDLDSSFEDLNFYPNSGNYVYTSSKNSVLTSSIKYKVLLDDDTSTTFGYDLNSNSNNRLGLQYSYYNQLGWGYGDTTSYNFEQIFLLLSGLYEDVKIDIETTSYTEFVFENGEADGYNPLLKENINSTDTGKKYKTINICTDTSISDSYLDIFTRKLDGEGNFVLDDFTLDAARPFVARYYPSKTQNGVLSGTIRVIFYGTGSRIKYGLHVMATHEDYSVYFTNGRFYNETTANYNQDFSSDVFQNLEKYSGRTYNNEKITGSNRIKSNKMVYMFTGNLVDEDYNGYFNGEYFENLIDQNESNFKFFVALTAFKNEIDVNTDSYLYNDVLNRTINESKPSHTDSFIKESTDTQIKYKFLSGDSRLSIYDAGGNNFVYQLDDKNKTNSWFNDVILSNIQYNYWDKDIGNFINKTWVNRKGEVSEIESQKMKGFDFSWDYYEIAGYYLKYVLIEIADFSSYYAIDIQSLLSGGVDPSTGYVSTLTVADNGYTYTFNIYYQSVNESNQTTGCIKFIPAALGGEQSDLENRLNTVSLMSNNIKVAFVSQALNYNIVYKSYDLTNVSTESEMTITDTSSNRTYKYSQGTKSQTFYYDSITKLNYIMDLPGYTFIGWGSYTFKDDDLSKSRYSGGNGTTTASIWRTQSSYLDVLPYFVQEGNLGLDNAKLFSNLYKAYTGVGRMPGDAFYVANGYFMTDTGYSDSSHGYAQNYNFFSNYVDLFANTIGKTNKFSTDRQINLYSLFKANTYTIQFDVNNSKGDNYYLDYNNSNQFIAEFTSDMIGFRTKVGENTQTFVCYVTFDTSNWYFSKNNGLNLLYSYERAPYDCSNMANSNNISQVVVDMFGYSWLGWYYKSMTDIRQGGTLTTDSLNTLVFKSSYINKLQSQGKVNLGILSTNKNQVQTFNKAFLEVMRDSIFDENITSKPFTYFGQHKADSSLSAATGYVYFYDYSLSGGNDNAEISGSGALIGAFSYVQVSDYLNSFALDANNNPLYAGNFTKPIVFSYYDTCISDKGYTITGSSGNYKLVLNKTAENLRIIKLYAYWSQNRYTSIYDFLDPEAAYSVDRVGSTIADKTSLNGLIGKKYYFNGTELQTDLNDIALPTRIGYDFVGWSFNHLPVDGDFAYLADTINSASSVNYLCKELLAQYAQLTGVGNSSNIESNILMIDGNRVASAGDSSWILNESGKAEGLGDSEDEEYRYIYLFPVWRVQTFSITVSLNISQEELKNLYEKDSSFALMLYEGAYAGKTFTGVSSKFFTNRLNTENYYNDIVANVCFEIDFDTKFEKARLAFNNSNHYYYLKDLFLTSAGYYFLGLMYTKTKAENNYIVSNTLNTVFTLNGLSYESMDQSVECLDDVFNKDFYDKLKNTKFVGESNSSGNYKNLKDLNDKAISSNFGTVSFNAYKTNNNGYTNKTFPIISETVGNQSYLFIIHNNVRYYVVYYLQNSNSFLDVITFDKTFLYYNEKDATGNVINRYIIRFDSDGKAYYVSNSFGNRVDITQTLRIALYSARRNTLLTSSAGGVTTLVTYSNSTRDGSLFGVISSYGVLGGTTIGLGFGNYTLINKTSREFTLYADWSRRENLTAFVTNGNNIGNSSDKNNGLAGFYTIAKQDNLASDSEKIKFSQIDNELSTDVGMVFGFYSTLNCVFLPYFNGRYLSEMTLEFDTLNESNLGNSSVYSMVHNTVVLRFTWDSGNDRFVITITSILVNGVQSSTAVGTANETNYVKNYLRGIDLLSILDKYSISSNDSSLDLYKRDSYEGREDVNKVTLKMQDIMCSVNITCKYSVQTYLVEVYSVIASKDLGDDSVVKTDFYTLNDMLLSSNYYPENRGLYGDPYISNINFANLWMSTISTNCAILPTVSYNIPYYYFVNSTNSNSTIAGQITDLPSTYGMKYLYNSNYYNGTNASTLIRAYHGALSTIQSQVSGYTFKNWYSFYRDSRGYVELEQYNDSIAIKKNTVIYGYFINENAPTKILFHYWDDNIKQYVQYRNNELEYTSGVAGSKVYQAADGNYAISELPSPSIAEWYGDVTKQFMGYIYITNTELNQMKLRTLDEKYNGLQYYGSNSFKATSGDIYSALSLNKLLNTSGNYITNTSATADTIYNSYVQNLSILDLLKYRMTVYKGKFFTKYADIAVSGDKPTILDAVRVQFGVDIGSQVGYVVRDFKMLNVESKFGSGETVYAIPIYEEMKLEIVACNTYRNTFNITSNSNMIESNIFETNSSYTIYYSTSNDLNFSKDLITNTNFITSKKVKRGGGIVVSGKEDDVIYQEYNLFSYEFNKNTDGQITFYVYYVKPGNVEFYRSAKITLVYDKNKDQITVQGIAKVDAKVDIYDSPLEVELTSSNWEIYKKAYEEIDKYGETIHENKGLTRNKQLLVYYLFQLTQCQAFEYHSNVNRPAYGYTNDYTTVASYAPTSSYSSYKYSISSAISIANKYVFMASGTKIETNMYGLYLMAYSMVDYFVNDQKMTEYNLVRYGEPNESASWRSNFFSIFENSTSNYLGSDSDQTKYQSLNPCDFLLDDRSSEETIIKSAKSDVKDIYAYKVKKNTDIGMFLYVSDDENQAAHFYVLTSGGPKKVIVETEDPQDSNYSNSYQYNGLYKIYSTAGMLYSTINGGSYIKSRESYDGVCNGIDFKSGYTTSTYYYFGSLGSSTKMYASSDYATISRTYPLDYNIIKTWLRSPSRGYQDIYYNPANTEAANRITDADRTRIESLAVSDTQKAAKSNAESRIYNDSVNDVKNQVIDPYAQSVAESYAKAEASSIATEKATAYVEANFEDPTTEEAKAAYDSKYKTEYDAVHDTLYNSKFNEVYNEECNKIYTDYVDDINTYYGTNYATNYDSYYNEYYNANIASNRTKRYNEVLKNYREKVLDEMVTSSIIYAKQAEHKEHFDEELLNYNYYKVHYYSVSEIKASSLLHAEFQTDFNSESIDDLIFTTFVKIKEYDTEDNLVEGSESCLMYNYRTNAYYYDYTFTDDGYLLTQQYSKDYYDKSLISGYEDENYWIVLPSTQNRTGKAYVYTRYRTYVSFWK